MNLLQHQRKIIIILIIIAVLIGITYLVAKPNLPPKNEGSNSLGAVNLLQTVCKKAINDYPKWTQADTDLVIWETPSKSFNYRSSPEEPSVGIDSPVKSPGTLTDMDFIGQSEISYVNSQDNLWQIGSFKLNGMSVPDNSIIYEQTQHFSFINISPINKTEFIVILVDENKGSLKYLNTVNNKESTLSKIPSINTDGLKLAVSPKGTYVYLLHDKTLTVFDINSKKQVGKIDSVESIVWLGDSYLLYSNQKTASIYDVKKKNESPLDKMDSASNLSFNPQGGGMFAYTQGKNAQIVDCVTGQVLGSKQNARLKTLTSDKTAIMEKEDFFGFWKFKNADWTVTFIEKGSNIATVWGKY